jgi:hypothetical protein
METSYEHSNFYFMKYLFFLIGAFAFTSCTKEVITPKANTSEYRLIKKGKQDGLKYEVYELGTDNNAHLVYAWSPRDLRGIEFIVQQDDNDMWEMYDIEGPDTFCWGCLGDCINEAVGGALQAEPAVTLVASALCPECAVGAVVGVTLACASLQF